MIMANGAQLLNVIRYNASAVYQDRIPEATADNIESVGGSILQFEATSNEFLDALINRIGLVILNTRMMRNPLAPMKKGMLTVGQSAEQIHVDLIKSMVYDPIQAQNELFKRHLPNVYTIFHTVDSQLSYPLTISNEQLKMAFLSYDALDRFIAKLVDSMYSSATQDEFIQMKALIADFGSKGYFQTCTVPAIVDEASAKEAMVYIKAMSDRFTFGSQAYNSAGVWTLTPKDEQYLLVTPEINARLNVEVLAMAFNMDKAEFAGHIIVVDDFGGLENNGVECLLVDRDWMQVYDSLRTFKTAYNGAGLYWNYFYHVWMIYSTSRFNNAIAFISGTPTVTTFTVTPTEATVKRGDSVQLVTAVTGTNNPTSKGTYVMSGNASTETFVTPLGKVVVSPAETATTLTITVTSVADTTKTATSTITVS